MKLDNLEQAVRYKERLDRLNEMKNLIESHITTAIVSVKGGLNNGAKEVWTQDDCLTGIVHKYCVDTIKLIEEAVEKL